jgi:hypothetical protein
MHDLPKTKPVAHFLIAAALLCALMLALWWPGVAMYDSVDQYGQTLRGAYDDWHPPVMARLWSVLLLLWDGQAPMFVLQAALYWLGLGLVAAALARDGAPRAAAAVLALGALPLFAGWQAAVLKDAQMAGAMLAATGLACWWRLAGRRLPVAVGAFIVLLLVYATLVRANGVFAVAPLACGLFGWLGVRRPIARAAVLLGLAGFTLLAAPLINHRIFAAEETGVARSLPVFDLAGIAHRAGPEAAPLLPPAAWQAMEARHCYTPFFWDPLADEAHCQFVQQGLEEQAPDAALFGAWAEAAVRHPLAYAGHRLAHWNATLRWLVPFGWPLAAPPGESEPNDLGLASPGPAGAAAAGVGGWLAETPLGWPFLWFAAALAALALARPEQSLAITLALSAASLEASFLLVSISSDLRYHLWPMLATGIAWALIAPAPPPRRGLWIAAGMVALLGLAGLAARLALPPVTGGYAAMLSGG